MAAPPHSLSFAGLGARGLCCVVFPHILQLAHLACQHLGSKSHDVLWEGKARMRKEASSTMPPSCWRFASATGCLPVLLPCLTCRSLCLRRACIWTTAQGQG